MEVTELNIGDKVSLRTAERIWDGIILESYDPEIILLKLDSGYNIGIREREILEVKSIKLKLWLQEFIAWAVIFMSTKKVLPIPKCFGRR